MKKTKRLSVAIIVALLFLVLLVVIVLAEKGIIPTIPYFIEAAPSTHGEIDIVCYNYKFKKEIGYKRAMVTPLDTDRDTLLDTFVVDATLDGVINEKGDFSIYVGNFKPEEVSFGKIFIPLSGVMSSKSTTMVTTIVEIMLYQLNSYKTRINQKLNELLNIPRKDSIAAKVLEVEINKLIAEEKKVIEDFNKLPYILGLKDPAISCYYLNLRELEYKQ
ncbi:MAG: hypothetical protein ABH822_02735 [Patescibacteria group bacterium]